MLSALTADGERRFHEPGRLAEMPALSTTSADSVTTDANEADAIAAPAIAVHSSRWWDVAAVVLLFAATIIFFWPVVSGQGWLPSGGGDSVSFLYPNYRFAADSLRSGTLPFWNPHQYAGAPFLADNQSGVFYPPNLALFALWPEFSYRGVEWLVILHFFFSGLAMYVCLRLLNPARPIARTAAVVGALAFMFSDVFITHIGNLNLIAVAAWLPLAFLGLHRAIFAPSRSHQIGWAVGGGVALGIATLAGHGQMTFLLAAFLGTYALYQTIAARRLGALPLLLLLGAVAIGVAAISLFPAAGTLQATLRSEFDYERSTSFALTWRALTGLVAPDFYGRGAASFWGDWLRVEAGYLGILPWVLALLAVFLRPNRQTLFYVLAGLLFLALALGPATPLYPLLTRWLPVVPFQVPARFVLLLDFCIAVLAAIGLDAVLKGDQLGRGRLRWFAGAAVGLALLVGLILVWQQQALSIDYPDRQGQMVRATLVFGVLAALSIGLIMAGIQRWLTPALVGVAAIALLFGDLYGLGRYVEIDWNDPTPGFAQGSPALAFLQNDPGIHRLDIATGAWQPNMPQIEGLYAARGVYNPLQLANYTVYMGSVGFRGSPSYNVMGVKYLIGGKKEPPGDTTFIVPVMDSDPDVTVYLNTRALPRALVLFQAEAVPDHDAAFSAVHRDDFDPATKLVIEEGVPLEQEPGEATIETVRYDLNHVAFNVTTDRPAYFFLSDIYHTDWQATINDEPAPILVGNYAFRALYLDAGSHRIEMDFVPTGWRAGVILTSLTWLAIAAIVVILARAGMIGWKSAPQLEASRTEGGLK